MATNFKLKRSSVANKRPGLSNLELGELALNTYDGFLFTERNGLGITTVTNLTPWYENYGAGSIFYTNKVGIGTTAVPDANQLLVKGGTETDRLNVTGISTHVGIATFNNATFHDDVTFVGSGAYGGNIVFDESQGNLEFADGSEATFGDGADLRIFHVNGYNYFRAGTTNSEFHFKDAAGGNLAKFKPLGNNELYFNKVKKFETTISGISVTGTTDTDNFINAGVSTFVGIITASATENVIPFLYSNFSDLPSATSYHGAFAHVHARGKGYFAHAANWYELVNKELDGTIGVGTEQVRVGVTTVTDFNATGNVTLGDADTDNVVFNAEVNSDIIPNTNIAYDLGSTTKRWGTLFTGATTKIDSDIVTRNLSVTGLGTFANDVTFTGASYNAVWDQSDNALEFVDNAKAIFGTGGDLEVYTDGSDSYVENSSSSPNNLYIRNRNSGKDIVIDAKVGERSIHCKSDSTVELYYDGTKRLATSGVGVTVYNQLDTTNINASGIITAVDGNFTGNVSIAGTLTYQDVTNVDSVGIATARVGLDVLSGGINAVGIVTADGLDAIGIQSGGVNITTGIITAINFTGTGNTVTYDSSTKIVSVSVGGAGGGTGGKFVANNTGIHTLSNVGIGTTTASDKLKVLGDVAFTGALKVSPLGLSGSNGNYLKSVGSGVTWAAFPTARTVGLQTATANQTSFPFTYNVGFLDVYINGVKLTTNEFTATNGTSVVLTEGAFVGDQVQFISFNTTATGGGGGSGISEVVQDTTPQLGGNLDLNSKIINGSGNIDYTGNFKASGIATATTFVGNLTGNVTGTATEATNVTVSANNTTNETVYPVFVDGATGTQGAETDTGLTYNPSTGNLTATKFTGDGSSLTGISGSGVSLSGSTNNTVATVTGANALIGEANLTFDGSTLGIAAGSSDNKIQIDGTNPYIQFREGTTNKAYIQWSQSGYFQFGNEEAGEVLRLADGESGLIWRVGTNNRTVWTSGNDGASSGLDSDLLDGQEGSYYTNATNLASGTIPDARFPATLPAVSGANLTNLPASGISTDPSNVQATWKLGGGSGSGFTFTGPGQDGSEGNPDIYLVRGQRYLFDNTALAGNHPFEFRNEANNADYTDGVSGAQNGLQYINVQHDAPAALKYRCTIHTSSMLGNIYIVGQHLANGANNRILTATSAYGLNGEQFLTFDGDILTLTKSTTTAYSATATTNDSAVNFINSGAAGHSTIQLQSVSGGSANTGQATISAFNESSGSKNTALTFGTRQNSDATVRERLRITSGGDVGINETGPSGKLDVASGSDTKRGLRVTGGASGGTEIAQFRTNNGTARFTVNNDVTVNTGNLVIGTSGKGIDFSATGGPASGTGGGELLDDYEQGTFSPAWFDDGGVFVSSYSVQYGQYTKIGNVVYFCFGLRIGSFARTPNSGQACRVGNLPYVSRVVGDDQEPVFNLYARLWGSGTPPETAWIRQSSGGSGSNHVDFYMDESQTGNDHILTGADFDTSSTCRVVVNGFYFTS